MDDSIEKMFEEKNISILINKLNLDIDNNSNSVELTLKLRIPLLKNKLIRKISRFFNEENIEYTISDIDEIVSKRESIVLNAIMKLVNERKASLSNAVSDNSYTTQEKIVDLIHKITIEFREKLNVEMNNEIFIELNNILSEKYLLKNEEVKEKQSQIFANYDNEIENSIINIVEERNRILINQINDTYSQYRSLNEKTGVSHEKSSSDLGNTKTTNKYSKALHLES